MLLLLAIVFTAIAAGNTIFGILGKPLARKIEEVSYRIYLFIGHILYAIFQPSPIGQSADLLALCSDPGDVPLALDLLNASYTTSAAAAAQARLKADLAISALIRDRSWCRPSLQTFARVTRSGWCWYLPARSW
jgi:hypothetical protein